jgi:hypothetical protein
MWQGHDEPPRTRGPAGGMAGEGLKEGSIRGWAKTKSLSSVDAVLQRVLLTFPADFVSPLPQFPNATFPLSQRTGEHYMCRTPPRSFQVERQTSLVFSLDGAAERISAFRPEAAR